MGEPEKRLRGTKKAQVTRAMNSIERYISEDDEGKVKELAEKMKNSFAEFEDIHLRIHELLEDDKDIDDSDEYFFTFQKLYVTSMNRAKEWLKVRSKDNDSRDKRKDEMNYDFHAVAALPKVEIDTYDGNPLNYHNFMALFDETVDKVVTDDRAKLTRLLQYTKGEAKEAIKSCILIQGGEGYNRARDILRRRFGNDYLVMEKIISNLRHGNPVKSSSGLQSLADELQNCEKTLSQMKKLSEVDNQSCILDVVNRLEFYLQLKWKHHVMEYKRKNDEYPAFKEFVDFINLVAEEASDPVYGKIGCKSSNIKQKSMTSSSSKVSTSFSSSVGEQSKPTSKWKKQQCVVCAGDHKVLYCDSFRRMKPVDRLKLVNTHDLCKICLMGNHKTSQCRKDYCCMVPGCGQRHSKFIHVAQSETEQVGSNVVSANTSTGVKVHLPIVSVKVNDVYDANVILDTASSSSFCSSNLASRLGLNETYVNYKLSTLHGSSDKCAKVVNFKMSSLDSDCVLHMANVIVIDDIPATSTSVNTDRYSYLEGLPLIKGEQKVDILIGQDYAEALLPLEVLCGNKGDPFAVRTVLGWSLNGPARSPDSGKSKVISHFVSTSVLERKVDALWNIENEPLVGNEFVMSKQDKDVIDLWDKTCRKVDGHYELPIPWKPDVKMTNNLTMAMSRLRSLKMNLEKRGLTSQYNTEILKLFSHDYAEVVPVAEIYKAEGVWYLPHHAVVTDRKPGKIRVVFDCAARFEGESLNDKCMKGPDLNNRLLDVLLRFRQFQFAVTSDVEAMYYQVIIPPSDRDALRFLWFDEQDNICHFRMTRHVFGGIWCAASSIYAMRKILSEMPGADPIAVDTVRRSFYVDDCLRSVPRKEDAFKVVHATKGLLSNAGFRLTKFIANDADVLSSIPVDDRAGDVKDLSLNVSSKVLGVQWCVSDDQFFFDVHVDVRSALTRRSILSIVSSVFDPLGLISPVILLGRLIFQDATRLRLSWDEIVPESVKIKWDAWICGLKDLVNVRIPRCVTLGDTQDVVFELHHFSDASLRAYGCCTYLRSIDRFGNVHTALLMSRSKVAPLKSVTIPRLELLAATMSAQVDHLIKKELDLDIATSYFWTDSEIVLKYIKNETCTFHIFVSNRVSLIRELTDVDSWFRIQGKLNPADVVSRGASSKDLNISEWCRGPEFLSTYKCDWKKGKCDLSLSSDDPEVKDLGNDVCVLTSLVHGNHPMELLLQHYGDWRRLKRAVAWWMRLIKVLKNVSDCYERKLTIEEINLAEIQIIKYVQQRHFGEEIQCLLRRKPVKGSSCLSALDPYLDANCVLRVGGRLRNAVMNEANKHPYIVPVDSPVARLIVQEVHAICHLGIEWVVSKVREKFWITKIRRIVKSVIHYCVTCRRLFATPSFQKMADHIPEEVVAGHAPFTFTGVDCFGPFIVKQGRSDIKRYGCIFTCLNIRAVHLEKLATLEADSFINALSRFICRRGVPMQVWSDNGTNFVGARSEISKALDNLDYDKLQNYAVRMNFKWHFNPPGASHMGGSWERMIRTVRKVFAGLVGINSRLTDEILDTFFCEIEAIINGRPITKVSDDVNDLGALTPNHLLLLREQPSLPPGKFCEADLYKRRWRCVQYLSQEFWRRWLKEYLPELQKRQKWRHQARNFKIGDLVLIVEENTPRGIWPMGLITEVSHGSDGLVRSVKIKTRCTCLSRPVTKVVLLEGYD